MVLQLVRTNEIEEKKTIFIDTDQPVITSFYIKRNPFYNFLRKGRVRVNIIKANKSDIVSMSSK